MDAEHGRIDPVLVDKQPTLKKEKCLLRLANLKGFDANFTKLLMCSGRWGWMSDLDKVLVHKATVFRRKGEDCCGDGGRRKGGSEWRCSRRLF
jgi:hypothetical protein